MSDLEKRVEAIEERNARVESDKDWETSLTRRASIAVLTYGVIVSYLFVINNNNPWLDAIVPSVGFFLSTMIMGGLKTYWQSRRKQPGDDS